MRPRKERGEGEGGREGGKHDGSVTHRSLCAGWGGWGGALQAADSDKAAEPPKEDKAASKADKAKAAAQEAAAKEAAAKEAAAKEAAAQEAAAKEAAAKEAESAKKATPSKGQGKGQAQSPAKASPAGAPDLRGGSLHEGRRKSSYGR